jgi:hypothetical protein
VTTLWSAQRTLLLPSLEMAEPDIIRLLDDHEDVAFKRSKLRKLIAANHEEWRLDDSITPDNVIAFLERQGKLKRYDFPFPYRKEVRFARSGVSLLEVLLSIKTDPYFTHYTAVRMHGLTEQLPKTIYLNYEQRPHVASSELHQDRIDAAFSRPQRLSNNQIEYGDVRICLINGMHTGQLGVIKQEVTYEDARPVEVRLTGVERTLIDITVRPVYAGGVFEVLKAYRLAKGNVSTNRIAAMLQKLGYVYPYHQAIGFYLERAGFRDSAIDLFRRFPMEFDFYLTHRIGEREYIKSWKLFVPKGL